MDDIERTREVYKAALDIVPHKKFTFAKLWIMYSHFEVRQKNLPRARKIMGAAIGKCPKTKIFRGYIDLEIQLREFERCRLLYEKFLQFNPSNCSTWIKYAELESILGDNERARAVYELATNQTSLDMPEVLWKSYIDYEIAEEEYDLTRTLYRRLLDRTQHVKVWISFAQFEKSLEEDGNLERSRRIYKEGCTAMKGVQEKEERLMLLESWLEFETELGTDDTREVVTKMMPQKVKKRRKIQTQDEMDAGWEEFYDYIFPDDEAAQPNLKLLAMAKRWKDKQIDASDDEEDEDDDADNDNADNDGLQDDANDEGTWVEKGDANEINIDSDSDDDVRTDNNRTGGNRTGGGDGNTMGNKTDENIGDKDNDNKQGGRGDDGHIVGSDGEEYEYVEKGQKSQKSESDDTTSSDDSDSDDSHGDTKTVKPNTNRTEKWIQKRHKDSESDSSSDDGKHRAKVPRKDDIGFDSAKNDTHRAELDTQHTKLDTDRTKHDTECTKYESGYRPTDMAKHDSDSRSPDRSKRGRDSKPTEISKSDSSPTDKGRYDSDSRPRPMDRARHSSGSSPSDRRSHDSNPRSMDRGSDSSDARSPDRSKYGRDSKPTDRSERDRDSRSPDRSKRGRDSKPSDRSKRDHDSRSPDRSKHGRDSRPTDKSKSDSDYTDSDSDTSPKTRHKSDTSDSD